MRIPINIEEVYKYYSKKSGTTLNGTKDTKSRKNIKNKKIKDNVNIDRLSLINEATMAIARDALELTPIKTGKLRDSLKIDSIGTGYKIWYDCEYAPFVHEISFYQHQAPTQYKFLEDAADKINIQYLLKYGIDLNITITYSPLAIYIGFKNSPGEKLTTVKSRQKENNTEMAYKELYEHLDMLELDNISEEDEPYYTALYSFIIWWGAYRGKNTEDILKSWLDRTRHNLVDLNYRHKWHW